MDFIWFHLISICRIGFFQCWDPGWRFAGFFGWKLWKSIRIGITGWPWKINGWNIIIEVWFRSFSFLNGWFDLYVPAVNLPGCRRFRTLGLYSESIWCLILSHAILRKSSLDFFPWKGIMCLEECSSSNHHVSEILVGFMECISIGGVSNNNPYKWPYKWVTRFVTIVVFAVIR